MEVPKNAGSGACDHDQRDDPDQQAAHRRRL
jgi:hypothetical protein